MNENLTLKLKRIASYDLPAGIAVFFVAIPLCLGIAHASGAPLIAGLITGILGGIVTGGLSGAPLSVSGPAAGLTAIAISVAASLGSYEGFVFAVALAGLLQIAFGALKLGSLSNYVPNTVIKGMLAGIGVLLIIKQFPHLVGYDLEEMGVEEFLLNQADINENYHDVHNKEANTFTLIEHTLTNLNKSIFLIGLLSLAFLFVWEKYKPAKLKIVPGSILVVGLGIGIDMLIIGLFPELQLTEDHRVAIPILSNFGELVGNLRFPDFSIWNEPKLYLGAATIAIVASIETLLSVQAVDKLDPINRKTPTDRELVAQGAGNILAGLLGAIPMTSVIVRGSVNVNAGARSKAAAIIHGVLLMSALLFFANLLNLIPLASLAAILIYTGIKLIKPEEWKAIFLKGYDQFIPYVVTIVGIILSDLLIGVILGIVTSGLFILKEDFKAPVIRIVDIGLRKKIILGENLNFLHKPKIIHLFDNIEKNQSIEIDGSRCMYIDRDILEIIFEFKENLAKKNIPVILAGFGNMKDHNKEVREEMKASYEKLFSNNKKWVEDRLSNNPEYFLNLTKGQSPQYLFIGCSDSRVPANEITQTDPGEMFVHRNIANLVVNTDINLMSVLQYSVEVLNVKHVIVCGHYGCGGVKAAMDHDHHGLIDKWLRNIKDVYRLHYDELESITNEEEQHRKLVELNVQEQVFNLLKTSYIQKNRMLYGFPEVHGWVYDLANGYLKDLKIDNDNLSAHDSIYKIY